MTVVQYYTSCYSADTYVITMTTISFSLLTWMSTSNIGCYVDILNNVLMYVSRLNVLKLHHFVSTCGLVAYCTGTKWKLFESDRFIFEFYSKDLTRFFLFWFDCVISVEGHLLSNLKNNNIWTMTTKTFGAHRLIYFKYLNYFAFENIFVGIA